MRGATHAYGWRAHNLPISIHTPHAGSDDEGWFSLPSLILISIHTPHAGSDVLDGITATKSEKISIHTPHAGSDGNDLL